MAILIANLVKEESMNNLDNLSPLILETEGFLNVKDALRFGYSKELIDQYIEEKNLYKLSPGFYLTQEAAVDEMFLIRMYSNNAIFSHETALYLNHLADRNSFQWVLTAPSGYSGIHLRAMNVEVHFMKKDLYALGKVEAKSTYGRTIYTYNAERTICDVLRGNNHISAAILEEALTRYAALEDKDLDLLAYYARQFRVEGLLRRHAPSLIE